MRQCLIYNNSLRFSRAIYGALTLFAFFIRSEWLVLSVSLLMILGIFSIKLNLPYQFHSVLLTKLMKKKAEPTTKEVAEVNFVTGMTGALLLIGFLLIYFSNYDNLAWIFILIVTLLIFLACLVGFCVATLTYVLLKKIFIR